MTPSVTFISITLTATAAVHKYCRYPVTTQSYYDIAWVASPASRLQLQTLTRLKLERDHGLSRL